MKKTLAAHAALPLLGALAALPTVAAAQAQTLYTETFEAATAIGLGCGAFDVTGTDFALTSGCGGVIGQWGAAAQGHFQFMLSGGQGYGSSTAVSKTGFNLAAGTTYTVQFDYSRAPVSAGNGPFDSTLTVALGGHEVSFNDVTGFYYSADWQTGLLRFTATADAQAVPLTLTVSGPAGGYSAMAIDNIVLTSVSAVPEPAPLALIAVGLLALRRLTRSRRA